MDDHEAFLGKGTVFSENFIELPQLMLFPRFSMRRVEIVATFALNNFYKFLLKSSDVIIAVIIYKKHLK